MYTLQMCRRTLCYYKEPVKKQVFNRSSLPWLQNWLDPELTSSSKCVSFGMVKTFSTNTQTDAVTGLPLTHPQKGQLVYGAPLGRLVKGVKTFSISTSIVGLGLQPVLIMQSQGHALATKLAVGGMMSFFIFVTPLMIHWITKKYVTDCYFNKDTKVFTASTVSFLLRRKEVEFMADDVVVPDIPGMFTSIVAKGRPLFVDAKMFYDKNVYIHLMGYDKPMDWELPNPNRQESVGNKGDKS